jgi:hypothetical protein
MCYSVPFLFNASLVHLVINVDSYGAKMHV